MSYQVKRSLACFMLIFGTFMPLGFAAPQLKLIPLKKQVSMGQLATLKVQLEWPRAEESYEIHSLEPKPENLVLEEQNQSQEAGTTVVHTLTYKFRPLKSGAALIYPFEISYRKSEAEPWSPILIPEQNTKVVPAFPLTAVLIGLAALVALSASGFAGFQAWQTLKARKAAKNIAPPDPKQRIYAKAEESIATFNSPNAKEKLAHWSQHLRAVVTAYYEVPPTVKTNAEVLSFLRTKGLPGGEWQEILRLFEQMNELQFSRQDIPSCDLDRTQKALLQYVKGKIIIGIS